MRPARDILLDTGPLVAAIDAADQWHGRFADAVQALAARLVTSEAVLTEACHLVGRGGARPAVVLDLIDAAGIPVVPLDRLALREAARLMDRYGHLPMDYADATLVVLADGLGAESVLTGDRRGFHTYRTGRGRPLTIIEWPRASR